MNLYQLSFRILPLFMCMGFSSSICLAQNLSLLLDKDLQESLITINGKEFIENNQIKALANKSYQYFSVKKENGIIYEAYITQCSQDYLKNLNKNEAEIFEKCADQVMTALDKLMNQTKNLRIHFTGTQYVYDGDEDNTLSHNYSFVHVKNYYMTNEQKHPMYGVIYRCKVNAASMELKQFIEQAKNSCANSMAVSASSSLK